MTLSRWKLWAGAAAATAGVATYALGGARGTLRVIDGPGRIDELEKADRRFDRLLEDARLKICELEGFFASECPQFASAGGDGNEQGN